MLFPFGPRLQYCTVPLLFGNLFTGIKWIDFKTELEFQFNSKLSCVNKQQTVIKRWTRDWFISATK